MSPDTAPPSGGPARARYGPPADVVRSAVVGLLAGACAVVFRWAIYAVDQLRLALLAAGYTRPQWGWALAPLLGFVAGCLVGWLTVRFAPDAPGSGIPHIKGVLRGARTMTWRALLPVKFAGGALGIGSGLSLGLEGPTVQMGACAAQAVGEASGLTDRARRPLIASGAGAGLAAVFNAPLAGFIFTLEELRRPLLATTYSGSLIAVVCSVMLGRALTGQLPSFEVQGFLAPPLSSFPLVLLLGVVAGVLGVAFNRSLLGLHRLSFRVRAVPRWCLPGLVGAAVGLVAWWLPDATGGGHAFAQRLLTGAYPAGLGLLCLLLTAKFALTVGSYASGAPGGIFAPLLVLGTIAGVIVGQAGEWVCPTLVPTPTAFAVLGMAAVFTASVRAPLTGITLILEMTRETAQIFALCAACLASYLVAEGLGDRPVYDALLEDDVERRRARARDDTNRPSPPPSQS
jgi:chloride channel protein, CIC family